MARSGAEWNKRPAIEHVDSRIYTDEALFEQELARIWKKVWVLACHGSELPEAYDFRTLTVARASRWSFAEGKTTVSGLSSTSARIGGT